MGGITTSAVLPAAKKLQKIRTQLLATIDPEARAYLEKRKRKLERALAPRTTKTIPAAAFQLRHKYVK